jgi:hypothetical protein
LLVLHENPKAAAAQVPQSDQTCTRVHVATVAT